MLQAMFQGIFFSGAEVLVEVSCDTSIVCLIIRIRITSGLVKNNPLSRTIGLAAAVV